MEIREGNAQSPESTTTTTAILDGFSVRGRMRIFKYLIFELDNPSKWNRIPTFWLYHWLWGYAAQLDWQHRSGRLSDIEPTTGIHDNDVTFKDSARKWGDRISIDSWWGFMNFCFSVCILLGAEKAGLVTQRSLKLDATSYEWVERNECIQRCIDQWAALFGQPYSNYKKSISNILEADHEFADARFKFQKEVWKAHTNVIFATIGYDVLDVKNAPVRRRLELLPEPEQKFGLGWCRMVELLASLSYPTNLKSLLMDGAGYLPICIVTPEKLKEWQAKKNLLSFCDKNRLEAVLVTHKLYQAPQVALQLVASFYRGVVQTPEIADSMPQAIKLMTSGAPIEKFLQMVRILGLFGKHLISHMQPKGILEWSVATAITIVAVLLIRSEV